MTQFGRAHTRRPSGRPHKKADGRLPNDDPHIKHSHLENDEINLGENYEVKHAENTGAIKVHVDPDGKAAGIEAVPGRTEIKDGKLLYVKKGRKSKNGMERSHAE